MDVKQVNQLHKTAEKQQGEILRLGAALLFMAAIMLYTIVRGEELGVQGSMFVVIAAMIGAYMAMNIGANDVANNVGPAVGSGALTMGGAILIAGIFEASGAIIAGGEVAGTIRNGIIDPAQIPNPQTFMWLMLAALLAAALWLNLATYVGAPVSTTHAIVGAVLGAGIAAGGFSVANWDVMGKIAASWVISPLSGAFIAAAILYLIKRTITYRNDKAAAAVRWVPIFVAVMAGVSITYLITKGLGKLIKVDILAAYGIGVAGGVATYLLVRPRLKNRQHEIENSKEGVNSLFTMPLIFSAALLSFAHGSNDVANAIGPLAAIVEVVRTGTDEIHTMAPIPFWVMMIGALGLSIGLWLYGPKLIRTVGSEITEIDRMRAFCIAMSATLTVIVASQLGLPVSTTHIAVGAVIGVGILREYLKTSYAKKIEEIKSHHLDDDPQVHKFIARFNAASIAKKGQMLEELKKAAQENHSLLSKQERKGLKTVYRTELVKRSLVLKIIAAWLITVPAAALLAAILFFTIRGIMFTG
jgi:PiT family inorganic phosphate transporter